MNIAPQPVETKEVRLLLLGGTGEARDLAIRLAGRRDLHVTVSLAGATRSPAEMPLPTRIGGFGGEAGQEAFLKQNAITHVIDATHPFAARITARTAALCARLAIPYLHLRRPGWTPGPGDRWTMIDSEEDAAQHIPAGASVFLATGRQTLDRFAALSACRLICRQIDPPDAPFPFPNGEYLIGRPPFSVAQERETFTRLGIDWLVVKDAGGTASRSKLDAARELGIPVLMIRRPPAPDAPRAATVDEALAWLLPGDAL